VCDLFLLNLAVLVVSGLSGVHGTLGRILLSCQVHMHSRLRSLRQGQVHVGIITWEVLPHMGRGVIGSNTDGYHRNHICFIFLFRFELEYK
jgi:hypothetical protein